MNKKLNTVLFILISTIVNIVVLLLLIAILIVLSTLVISKVFKAGDNANVVILTYTLCFVVAMVANMMLSAKVSSWVIKHFNLENKLDTRPSKGTKKQSSSSESKEEKKKTVLPDSVLMKEDEDPWESSR